MSIILTVQECPETGEPVLIFPDDLCEELGWQIGDDLIWEEVLGEDSRYIIRLQKK